MGYDRDITTLNHQFNLSYVSRYTWLVDCILAKQLPVQSGMCMQHLDVVIQYNHINKPPPSYIHHIQNESNNNKSPSSASSLFSLELTYQSCRLALPLLHFPPSLIVPLLPSPTAPVAWFYIELARTLSSRTSSSPSIPKSLPPWTTLEPMQHSMLCWVRRTVHYWDS